MQWLKRRALHRIAVLLVTAAGCTSSGNGVSEFGGETMGTTYRVRYVTGKGPAEEEAKPAIEQLLVDINQALSTYIKSSVISRINRSTDTEEWHAVDGHFESVFRKGRRIHDETGGAFNPAVGPLVQAWGFGPDGPHATPDQKTVNALLRVVSFKAFDLRGPPAAVRKRISGAQLDFNAIAEGYAIDTIATWLEEHGVQHYLIEIGGEVRAHGRRPDGEGWRVGIERPSADALAESRIQTVLALQDAALATSGIYRNYRVEDGRVIAHILNPHTGYPQVSSLLSVSVLAQSATTADGYATAFMVMGLEDALKFVEAHENLEAYFVSRDSKGNITETRSSGFPPGLDP